LLCEFCLEDVIFIQTSAKFVDVSMVWPWGKWFVTRFKYFYNSAPCYVGLCNNSTIDTSLTRCILQMSSINYDKIMLMYALYRPAW